MSDPGDITQLLIASRDDPRALMDRLLPLVYEQLREVARGQLRRRTPGQTLDTTALVHDAYLKLVDQERVDWKDRQHFLAVSAVAMRHILVDHARRRAAQKRGGDVERATFDEAHIGLENRAVEILALDEALQALAELDPRLVRLVELRFFGGLTVEETAGILEVSDRTIKRDWRKARAFLHHRLQATTPAENP